MAGYFDRITGHEKIKEMFRVAHKQNRLFSTYIFKGPEGIGKKLMALGIAAMINCDSEDNAPCGQCIPCLKAESGNHVDIMVVEAEKDTIVVEQVEELIAQTQFPPFEGKGRVVIIDDAHLLGTTSANMLLKTLEEPPPANHFFLITSKPDSLLSTIRSRSQEIFLRSGDLEKHLYVTGLPLESIRPYVNMGGGFTKEKDVIDAFSEERELALKLIMTIVNNSNIFEYEQIVTDAYAGAPREQMNRFFQLIQMMLRDILVIKGGRKEAVFNQDLVSELSKVESRVDSDWIFYFSGILGGIKSNLYYNISIKHLATILISEGRKRLS